MREYDDSGIVDRRYMYQTWTSTGTSTTHCPRNCKDRQS